MARRSPARWLAPVALVTVAVAVYAVANATLKDDGGDGRTTTAQRVGTGATVGTSTGKRSTPSRSRKTYTVKAGDVLSAIAERTGVTVAELEELNPDVDASALRPGQKLRLRK